MNLNFIFDIALRLLTILVRALFTFYLVKTLSLKDFGMYSYLLASVAFSIYLVGADFYAYAHREMLSGKCTREGMIKSHGTFLSYSFLLASVLLIIASWNSLPPVYLLLLPVLLAGEAITAEYVRLLIVCGRPSAANIVNFMKSAAWMLPLWIVSYWYQHFSLEIVIFTWAAGLILAMFCGTLLTPVRWSEVISAQVPAGFFREAGRILPRILLGTLALRALFSLDRLFVSYGFDVVMLGTYGFYVAVASAYLAVIDAGVLARLFPPLVAASVSDLGLARRYRRNMELTVFFGGFLAWILYELFIDYVIVFVDKQHLLAYKRLGSIVLVSYVVYALSMGAHYILYGRKRDVEIMIAHLLSLIPFSIMAAFSYFWQIPEFIAGGVLLSMCLQLISKIYMVQKYVYK